MVRKGQQVFLGRGVSEGTEVRRGGIVMEATVLGPGLGSRASEVAALTARYSQTGSSTTPSSPTVTTRTTASS